MAPTLPRGAQRLKPEQGKRGNTGRAVKAGSVNELIGMEVGREGNKEKTRRGGVFLGVSSSITTNTPF